MTEKIYTDLASAQEALDRGETVRIAMEPYALDPALLQLGLDLNAQKRMAKWKETEQAPQEKVVCDLCGSKFLPDDGSYEPGKYSYCSECSHR